MCGPELRANCTVHAFHSLHELTCVAVPKGDTSAFGVSRRTRSSMAWVSVYLPNIHRKPSETIEQGKEDYDQSASFLNSPAWFAGCLRSPENKLA